MTPLLLSGKEPAHALLESLRGDAAAHSATLAIVQVGDDAASNAYVVRKLKAAMSIGMKAEHVHLPVKTTFSQMLEKIHSLNNDKKVTGFIVQLPLPEALWGRVDEIINAIDPKKDVDGFTDINRGKLSRGDETGFFAATPVGILLLLDHYKIPLAGKHCVIVGRSEIVGKPLSLLLLQRDVTVTVCHSKTTKLASHTKTADILISAVGQAGLITAKMVKKGAVVIDVGMTRTDEGLTGDVDFEGVSKVASAITPVPGGVGPMTVASLIANCMKAAKRS